MKTKKGINDKETEIRINPSEVGRGVELWINQTGITTIRQETLSYLTFDELLDLKEEIQKTLNEIITK